MIILNQVQVNLIYNTNRNLFLWVEIFPGEYFLVSTKLDTFCYLTVQTALCYVLTARRNASIASRCKNPIQDTNSGQCNREKLHSLIQLHDDCWSYEWRISCQDGVSTIYDYDSA